MDWARSHILVYLGLPEVGETGEMGTKKAPLSRGHRSEGLNFYRLVVADHCVLLSFLHWEAVFDSHKLNLSVAPAV